MDTTLRNATPEDLVATLRTQRAQRHDLVVPASFLTAQDGQLTIDGDTHTVMDEQGVATVQPMYRPTEVAEDGVSEKLGIHRGYLRRLRAEHVELWDANVNGWLSHESRANAKFLVRTLRSDAEDGGVLRALLTNGYKPIENLDVLVAALAGIHESGAKVDIDRCDLSERRMYVTMHSPDVAVMAPRLLDGYRGPWHVDGLAEQRVPRALDRDDPAAMLDLAAREGQGYQPGTEPVIFGGFELRNSDVGCGAFELTPKLLVKVCRNGLTMDVGKMRKVHLGARLSEGAIDWSTQTNEAQLALITSQTKDAVKRFLSEDHVAELIRGIEERAGVAITDPSATLKAVTKKLAYDDDVADTVLAHFIASGQLTAGGVMQAVTSAAQTVSNADTAASMESDAMRALDFAATLA